MREQVLSAQDLHVFGVIFGWLIEPREPYEAGGITYHPAPLVSMYIEDDENWHYKNSFDIGWLNDLLQTAQQLKELYETEYAAEAIEQQERKELARLSLKYHEEVKS